MKKRTITLTTLTLIATLGLLSFPGYAEKSFAASKDAYNITLRCGRLGMSSYILSVGLSEIVNKYSSRIRIQPMQTKGNTQSFVEWSMLPKDQQKYAMGVTYPLTVLRAKDGQGSFKTPWDVPRILTLVGNAAGPLWTLDPNIKDGKDLVGKKVSLAARGTDLEWANRKIAEKAWGLTLDKYKNMPTGHAPGADALLDGTLDAAMVGAMTVTTTGGWEKWVPIPPTEKLLTTKETYAVSFPEEAFAEVSKDTGYPMYPIKLEAKKIGKSNVPRTISFAVSNSWWVSKDMPDDVVEELLAIIYEHTDEFAKFHAVGKGITKQSLAMVYTDKKFFHPVAMKFLEGKGLKFFEDVYKSR